MERFKTVLKRFKSSRTYVLILGAAATLWFLVRVIPKPSRAAYPCMRVAAPVMSTFVIYLLGISASVFSFKKFRQNVRRSRYLAGAAFLIVSLAAFSFILLHDQKDAIARTLFPEDNTFPIESNKPIGEARGLYPGRVVWVQDHRATNENYFPQDNSTDLWYSNDNADEGIIYDMLAHSITEYAGVEDLSAAWDAIFRAYNQAHGKGDVGYADLERIAFKINLTNQSCSDKERPRRMDATPQLLNAILDQLVNVVGVYEGDITMGDPYREFRSEYRELVMSKFPDVYYVDGSGSALGVNQTIPSSEAILKFSNGAIESTLPQQYLDAEYVINLACLKTHNEGGITLIAKNHQGSFLEKGDSPKSQYAIKMHDYLPANSRGSRQYRHTVDYMGHDQTGGKGLIYIVDGIWAGMSWEGWIRKYKSAPFNNDYPNSLFVSQDPVALESVCYDVLFQEHVIDASKINYPIQFKTEIADYLSQCASSDFWPADIIYDPEGDGTPMESLGVFEHWNNPTDRKYSRNLDPENGKGIELNYMDVTQIGVGIDQAGAENINIASPNPFARYTTFSLPENSSGYSTLEIYSLKGEFIEQLNFRGTNEVVWNGTDAGNSMVPDGMYLYKIQHQNSQDIITGKVLLKR